uniref:Glutathione S-transferase omega 4 n=1 Tax=Chilo suppressalis TaxID=168631 RepID=A0A0K0XRN2_CHISP|nr:glutathione S-transferase omega 4 [Chilo suppressalis]
MIASLVSLSGHVLVTSYKVLHTVVPALEYVSSYWTMGSIKVEFNTKHLEKGDPLPSYNGKLRVYNMRYCPWAHRAILALNAKELDYEIVNINTQNKPDWLPSKSAFGKVPALEIQDGVSIYESSVIVEYLDEVYPKRPLLSKDPVTRAFDKIIVEAFAPVTSLFFRAMTNPEGVTDDARTAYEKALHFVQEQLTLRGTKFFGGSQPGYVDYMIWPWFERITILEGLNGHAEIDPQKYKLLTDYIAEMFKDPAVSQYVVNKDVLLKFGDAYKKKLPINYDMLLEQ